MASKEHAGSSDKSDKPVADAHQSSTDDDFKDAKGGDTTSSDEEEPPKRVTRARSREPAAASDSESDGPRTRGASKAKTKPVSASKQKKSKKGNNKGPAKKSKDGESDDSDSPGDYVHVQVGDCVILDSGDPEDPFVALEEVKALIKGGVLENEVFLSPHKDRNSIDAVIEVCQVVSPEEYNDIKDEIKRGFREKGKTFFVCRYKYYPNRSNIKKALEVVENEAIRSGLGRPKPNVGTSYQATIPKFVEPAPSGTS
uniref:BAH domain-containing protein n=1 Tax=Phytophthora ramorum TaxID=164328 RepID=H3GFX5_PHYRM